MENPKIIDCFCVWYDLLGYSTPFKEANWNLHNEKCLENYERIKNLEKVFHASAAGGITLSVNDGVAKILDITKDYGKDMCQLIGFITFLIDDFYTINEKDTKGARGVFTFGQRFEYIKGDGTVTYRMNKNGTIQEYQNIYYPKEFQMNTAFSKANIIEESGCFPEDKKDYLYFDKYALDTIEYISKKVCTYSVSTNHTEEYFQFNINNGPIENHATTLIFDNTPIECCCEEKGIVAKLYRLIGFGQNDNQLYYRP